MTNTTLAGFVAFSGKQAIGMDSNRDRLLESMLELHDENAFVVRGVTQPVLDAVTAGEDCLDVVLVDHGTDGKVYGLR